MGGESFFAHTFLEFHFHTGHFAPRRIGRQLRDIGVREQGDVRQFEDGADAIIVSVRLGLDQAGKAIARIAANTLALPGRPFVEFNADGTGKWICLLYTSRCV